MAPRLKVFVTSDGLTDYVVAVSSKTKALAAWGSHQDLFKTGLAHETDDAALVKAATAQPGEVLRRPAGSRAQLARLKPARAAAQAGPTKAQLKKIADLEAKLEALEVAHEARLAKLEAARARAEAALAAAGEDHQAERAKLQAALTAARRAPG